VTVTVVNKVPTATVVQGQPSTAVVSSNAQRGPTGPQGPTGATGATGAPGVSAVFTLQDTLTTYWGKSRFYFDGSYTVTQVRASVGTPATGSGITVQVNVNGTLAGTVTIPAGAYTAITTLSKTVIAGDYATVSVTAVGSTTPGADLTVSLNVQ